MDTIAKIADKRADGEAVVYRFVPRDKEVLRWVVEKGYVGLDGASLTVTKVVDEGEGGEPGWWEVMLISYTQDKVVMGGKVVGDEVNVEVDMVGKYVDKSVRGYFEGLGGGRMPGLEAMVERVVAEKLKGRP